MGEYVDHRELQSLDQRVSGEIKELRAEQMEQGRRISVLQTMFESMQKLPETMCSLDKTLERVCCRLDQIGTEVSEIRTRQRKNEEIIAHQEEATKEIEVLKQENRKQNEKIALVDGKSKFDWEEFVTKNFVAILLAIGVFYFAIKDLISTL